jgi:NAD(P)-dependent dehydrogenase (short-subunit alcohol dehydrogenase family)
VLISSIGGRLAVPYLWPYNAAKWGLEAIGDALRVELRPFGVKVALVEPGTIATPIWGKGSETASRIRGLMSAEQERLYGDALDRFSEERPEDIQGLPPERVAEVVEHALTARRPRTRYLVGRDAKLSARMRALLPDKVWDAVLARRMGL